MTTTISAIRLIGPYQEKPTYAIVPRRYWLERGLRFLCLFDSPQPRDLVTGKLATTIPTQNSNGGIAKTPWGLGCRITNWNGPLEFANHDNYNITGSLSILCRAKVDSNGSNSYWNGIVQKRAGASSVQTNTPFAWGCYNYYNYGDGTLKFSTTRANGGYRQFNGPTEEHIGTIWKNFAVTFPGVIETPPDWYMDGVLGVGGGQGTAGSGTGATGTNTDVLYFGDTGGVATDVTHDWMAIFAAKLTVPEIHEIMDAPFGELVEPEIGRDIHDLSSSYIFAPTSAPKVGGMRGGFNTGLDAGFR